MNTSFKFYNLCGKSGVTNKRLLCELEKQGIQLTKTELRNSLARAAALGYMKRKSQGYMFLVKICDRHAMTLLTHPALNLQNNYKNLDQLGKNLMFKRRKSQTRSNDVRHQDTMTDNQPSTSADNNSAETPADDNSESSKKNNANEKEESRSVASNDTGKFLRDCWNDWDQLIGNINKQAENRNKPCDSGILGRTTRDSSTSAKPGETDHEEVEDPDKETRTAEEHEDIGTTNVNRSNESLTNNNSEENPNTSE